MYLKATCGDIEFKLVYFLRWYKQGMNARIVIVGATEGIDSVITYKSYLVKPYLLSPLALGKFLTLLEDIMGVFRQHNQGELDIEKIMASYSLPFKKVDSILGKNLVQLYGRTTQVNGYFSDKNTMMAVSGHVVTESEIRMFVGDLKSAQIIYGMDIDPYLIDKLERAAFSNQVSHMDLLQTSNYITKEIERNTEVYKDSRRTVDLSITLEKWLEEEPNPKELKKKKKRKQGYFKGQ